MSRKVVELVLASGLLRQTPVEVLDATDVSVTSSPSRIVQATSSGLIHVSWIPEEATRVLVRDTEYAVVASGIRELVVASGDVIPLSATAVRIRTASDASSGGSGGGNLTDGNKGDITVSGSGSVWTINEQAVTLTKMQNMPSQSVLGRENGSGSPQHVLLASGLAIQNTYLTLNFTAENNPLPDLPSNGLLGYWTARANVTVDGSQRVSAWNAALGSGSFEQSSSSVRPLYHGFGKYNALLFPESSDRFLTSSLIPATGANPRSFAIAFIPGVRTSSSNADVFSYGTNTTYQAYGLRTHASNVISLAVQYQGVQRALSFFFSLPVVVVLAFNAGVTTYYINGASYPAINDSLLGLNTGSTVGLQIGRGVGASFGFVGFVFEFAAWNVQLTETQALHVSRQLMQRYQGFFLPFL